jgi:hypothetical protein
MNLTWTGAANTLQKFGGLSNNLYVKKTGLPFFDALQLYGAIALYMGLREDIYINDDGAEWVVSGRSRSSRLKANGERAFKRVQQGNLKPKTKRSITPESFYESLRLSLISQSKELDLPNSLHQANGPFSGLDSAIQSGIRGIAAASYHTMESGQSSDTVCIAQIPLSQGFLAVCGKNRTQTIGDIIFLPIFEGQVDLSKVVSPVSAWLAAPNPLCAYALMILALKVSLFAEGYQDRLTAVVYNKRVKQGDFAYSGLISIASTAVASEKMKSSSLASSAYQSLGRLIRTGWENGRATGLETHALAMATWVLHPTKKNLSAMIMSQERLHRDRQRHILTDSGYVKEIFNMTYKWKDEDYEAVRRFAKAVADAIFYARMKEEPDKKKWGKIWFDEVTLLRSAPSPRVFIRRAMYLVEKGHSKHSQIGTSERDHSFEPKLLKVMDESRSGFESFRDLFRMYLVQESKPPEKGEIEAGITDNTDDSEVTGQEEDEA